MKLAEVLSDYFTVRGELMRAVENLSQQQLDWKPPTHPASIGRLRAHIADCEYCWIEHVAGGKAGHPDFSRFEQAQEREEILGLLRQYEGVFTAYLRDEGIEDWDEVFYPVIQGNGEVEKVSKRYLVWNVVEHQARHRGQIFMLMRMQGLEVPNV